MLSLYGGLGLLVLAAAAIAVLCVPLLFGATMDTGAIQTLQTIMVPLGISTAIVVAGNPLNATLVAHERFVFLRSLEMVTICLVTAANVFALMKGVGVVSLVLRRPNG
jgi:hypothetical protein